MAAPNVSFAGRLSDADTAAHLSSCRALVVAAVEEFGIAAVEAQAAGRPVIAVRNGGTLETVNQGRDGLLLVRRARGAGRRGGRLRRPRRGPADCVENAARFDTAVFQEALPREVANTIAELDSRNRWPRTAPKAGRLTRPAMI